MPLSSSFEGIADTNKAFYEKLPSFDGPRIRLLTLHDGTWNDPIRGECWETSLGSTLAYNALSYNWGDAEDAQTVTINGQRGFRVTKNLYSALRRLRPMTVWIDQISINQADEVEKSDQVRLMREIFSKAETVYVWLGPCGANCSVDGEEERCRWMSGRKDKLHSSRYVHDRGNHQLLVEQQDETKHWWMRMWTFAEVILARNICVLIGSHRRKFNALINVLHAVEEAQSTSADTLATPRIPPYAGLRQILRMRNERMGFTTSMSPKTVLYNTADRVATDPRDKVFAVAGLLWEFDLVVDYSLPYEMVCKNATLALIKSEGIHEWCLNCLILTWPLHTSPSPSWVLDFAKRHRRPTSLYDPRLDVRGAEAPTVEDLYYLQPRFAASGDRPDPSDPDETSVYVVNATREVLTVRGVRFDVVQERFEPGHQARRSLDSFASVQRNWSFWEAYAQGVAVDLHVDECRTALEQLRVAMSNASDARTSTDSPIASLLLPTAWHQTVCGDIFIDRETWRHPEGLDQVRWPPWPKEAHLPAFNAHFQSNAFIKDALHLLHGRSCFTTSCGFPGLAGNGVQPGDIVAVLFGMSMPVVLRPLDDGRAGYQLVGECIVSGIMYGELVGMYWEGLVKDERFDLV